jgi:hypothetical protein
MNFETLFRHTWEQSRNNALPLIINTLILVSVSVMSFGILAPVATAGYISSVLQLVKDQRRPRPSDLFSEMDLFISLAIFGI